MLVESHKIPWFQTTNQIMYIYIKNLYLFYVILGGCWWKVIKFHGSKPPTRLCISILKSISILCDTWWMLVESHKIPWFQTTNQIMYIYIKKLYLFYVILGGCWWKVIKFHGSKPPTRLCISKSKSISILCDTWWMLVESHKIPWFQTTNQIMYIYIKNLYLFYVILGGCWWKVIKFHGSKPPTR